MSFIGNLHPLLVHFPVGIIGLAIIFKVVYYFTQNETYSRPVQPMILIGLISSILSVLTGLIHADEGNVSGNDLVQHRLYGILLSLLLTILYLSMKKEREYPQLIIWSLIGALLFFTGESGALLTHGYNLFNPKVNSAVTEFDFENVNSAQAYKDIIVPILSNKCYSCHSSKKQKGKLRLDTPDQILMGGENGKILSQDSSIESKFITNLSLPIEEEDHMPPQGKPQLTDTELKLITWWVNNGADFNKKVTELNNHTEIISLLEALNSSSISKENKIVFQNSNADKPSARSLQVLKNAGITANPIFQNSNLLSVHLNRKKLNDEVISALKSINSNIIFLHAEKDSLNKDLISVVSNFKNLKSLDLRFSNINEQDLSVLNKMESLEELNLVGTDISNESLAKIKLPGLRKLFLYQTKILPDEATAYKNVFPNLIVDIGNYQVPILKLDTSEYTREQYNLENNIQASKK